MTSEAVTAPREVLVARLTLDKATPSQNQYGKWYHHRQHRYREACTASFARQLVEMTPSPIIWAPKLPGSPGLFCRGYGCGATIGLERDIRGASWCMPHRLELIPPRKRRVLVRRFSAGILDELNFYGGCKAPIDALVHVGLLYDDSPRWMESAYDDWLQVKAPPGRSSAVFEVYE